jgi:PBP1b-binding outer membrane lipoprotein LpoB
MGHRIAKALLLSLLLSGCSRGPVTVPTVAEAPIAATDTYADKQDAAVERAAGYVKVARDENKKAPESEPKHKVDVLLQAASAFLDKPSEADIAKANALLADPKRIEAIKAEAEKAIKDINAAWSDVVKDAERRRVEAEQNLKRAQMELDAAAKREQAHLLGMLGAGLIATGTLLLLFGHFIGIGKFGAAAVIAAGAGTAALPRLFDSPYFVYGALSLLGVAGAQMLIALGRKLFARKQVQVDNETPTPS